MSEPWLSPEARERFIRFLELELKVVKNANEDTLSASLLGEFDTLLKSEFPRTFSYVQKKVTDGGIEGVSDEVRTIAWAEARSVPSEGGGAHIPGRWTEAEIAEDINECFRVARERAGL